MFFFPSKVYINLKACTSKLPNKISTLWAVVGFQIRIESLLWNSSTYRGSTEDPGLLLHLEVHEKLKNKYVRIEEGAIMQDYIRAKFDVEQKYVLKKKAKTTYGFEQREYIFCSEGNSD